MMDVAFRPGAHRALCTVCTGAMELQRAVPGDVRSQP